MWSIKYCMQYLRFRVILQKSWIKKYERKLIFFIQHLYNQKVGKQIVELYAQKFRITSQFEIWVEDKNSTINLDCVKSRI